MDRIQPMAYSKAWCRGLALGGTRFRVLVALLWIAFVLVVVGDFVAAGCAAVGLPVHC